MESVIAELEGTLLKSSDVFSYFMLMAFEASGLIRFTLLLFSWPLVRLLDAAGMAELGLKLATFVATFGVRKAEIESVSRAVLPKFFMDDLNMDVWRVTSRFRRRVVVTKMPRVMVEMFVKEHLRADEVVGCELGFNRFGFATGLVKGGLGSVVEEISRIFELGNDGRRPTMGMGRPSSSSSFLGLCEVSYFTFSCFFFFFNFLKITLFRDFVVINVSGTNAPTINRRSNPRSHSTPPKSSTITGHFPRRPARQPPNPSHRSHNPSVGPNRYNPRPLSNLHRLNFTNVGHPLRHPPLRRESHRQRPPPAAAL